MTSSLKSNERVVFGYHARARGKGLEPEMYDPYLFTHIGYTYFGITEYGDFVSINHFLDLEEFDGKGYIKRVNDLKKINPNLKTLAVVGGYSERSSRYSRVAAVPSKRRNFINTAVEFLNRYGFDGIDLSWEFPTRSGGRPCDKENFVIWLKEIKEEFVKHNFLLTAAVDAVPPTASTSYNIPEMSKHLDLISLKTYDLHGAWDNQTGLTAPLYNDPLSLDSIVSWWLEQGAPAEKLVLGVPFNGRAFRLADPTQHSPGAPIEGYGNGDNTIGFCEASEPGRWNLEWDAERMVPYAWSGNQWMSYEDVRSVELKAKYARNRNLAGVMTSSLDYDDFTGKRCGVGTFPLLKAMNRGIGRLCLQ